jgi:hypothetical protein
VRREHRAILCARVACQTSAVGRSSSPLDRAMRLARFFPLLFVAPALSGDFRSLNFGDSCATVLTAETDRGSVSVPWSRDDVHAFNGRDFNRDLTFTYFCPKGVLFAGNYYFPIESLHSALESYHDAYGLLISIYGAPFLDNTPWQVGSDTSDPRAVSTDPRKYSTSWKTERTYVHIMLIPPKVSGEPDWRVFVVAMKPKK